MPFHRLASCKFLHTTYNKLSAACRGVRSIDNSAMTPKFNVLALQVSPEHWRIPRLAVASKAAD